MGCHKYRIKPQHLFVPLLYDTALLGRNIWLDRAPRRRPSPMPRPAPHRGALQGVSHEQLPPQNLTEAA